jgi:hypothetical protein
MPRKQGISSKDKNIAAVSQGGGHAKAIVTAIHDPDQHQYHCTGARKHGADEAAASCGAMLAAASTDERNGETFENFKSRRAKGTL